MSRDAKMRTSLIAACAAVARAGRELALDRKPKSAALGNGESAVSGQSQLRSVISRSAIIAARSLGGGQSHPPLSVARGWAASHLLLAALHDQNLHLLDNVDVAVLCIDARTADRHRRSASRGEGMARGRQWHSRVRAADVPSPSDSGGREARGEGVGRGGGGGVGSGAPRAGRTLARDFEHGAKATVPDPLQEACARARGSLRLTQNTTSQGTVWPEVGTSCLPATVRRRAGGRARKRGPGGRRRTEVG